MEEEEIVNAKITYTKLGLDDHGFFTFHIGLEGNGWGVTLGSIALSEYKEGERVGSAYGLNVIMRILEVVGVDHWEDLVGKYVRTTTALLFILWVTLSKMIGSIFALIKKD